MLLSIPIIKLSKKENLTDSGYNAFQSSSRLNPVGTQQETEVVSIYKESWRPVQRRNKLKLISSVGNCRILRVSSAITHHLASEIYILRSLAQFDWI